MLAYSLLAPWKRVLLEKLIGLQLVKKFHAFYGTQRFITTFTSAHHLFLSWTNSIQSIPPHPTSWRSILILSSHLRLVPQVSLPKPCIHLTPPPYAPHAPPISLFLILSLTLTDAYCDYTQLQGKWQHLVNPAKRLEFKFQLLPRLGDFEFWVFFNAFMTVTLLPQVPIFDSPGVSDSCLTMYWNLGKNSLFTESSLEGGREFTGLRPGRTGAVHYCARSLAGNWDTVANVLLIDTPHTVVVSRLYPNEHLPLQFQ
jgi:hypothetical protein